MIKLAKVLNQAGLGVFPCAVNFNYSKHKWEKHPLTVKGEHWAVTAARSPDDEAVNWNGCKVFGVPIPDGIVIIDLDTYVQGCTTAAADMLFGAKLPWAYAKIQTTLGGGDHYAFRAPEWPVKQLSNIGGAQSGIDTRVGGKGFICSGDGYTPADSFGLLRMAYPDSLPVLPNACRLLLEDAAVEQIAPDLPNRTDRDINTIRKALTYIDPTERDTWRDIGFALKHHYHNDQQTGFELWDEWSKRTTNPDNYVAHTQQQQWAGFKVTRAGGTITIGTLYHTAMRNGWVPPAQFDTSTAFGAGAVPVEAFSALITRIIEQGGDTRHTEGLLTAITTSGCNEIQALLLRNELKAVMRSAKVLDGDLSKVIDRKTAPQQAPTIGLYAGNDTDNAELFIVQYYPGGTLIRCDSELFRYNGKCWESLSFELLEHQVAQAMTPARCQHSRISNCVNMVVKMCPVYTGGMNNNPPHRILFDNGVLDLNDGLLYSHSMEYLTTNILPYDYAPNAQCGEWLAFLNSTLDGDAERLALLQEWFGYMMASGYRHHKIMLMLGPKRCGKGTIGRILQQVVGEMNFSGGSLTAFATDSFIDSLRTKSVMFIGDAEKRLPASMVNKVIERMKSISGNDSVPFDRKFLSSLSETLPTRITIAANSVPNLFDDSGALASRLLVLPFNRSFYNNEDLYLFDKLKPELPGIAIWALEGLQRLNENGQFTMSNAGNAETRYISESFSPMSRFVAEACIVSENSECTSKSLHDVYRAWCLMEGEDILKRKTFVGAIKDATRGHRVIYDNHRFKDGAKSRGFKGIQPKDATLSATADAFKPRVVK